MPPPNSVDALSVDTLFFVTEYETYCLLSEAAWQAAGGRRVVAAVRGGRDGGGDFLPFSATADGSAAIGTTYTHTHTAGGPSLDLLGSETPAPIGDPAAAATGKTTERPPAARKIKTDRFEVKAGALLSSA